MLTKDEVEDNIDARIFQNTKRLITGDAANRALKFITENYLNIVDGIVNALTSTSTTKALSAYQGKVLQDTKQPLSSILTDTTASFTDTLEAKLNGIEAGAEVNNISDLNVTDLTDGGNTTLHNHDSRYYTETEIDATLGNYFNKATDNTDSIVEGSTNKFSSSSEKTKLNYLTVTQPVNLDTLESDTATNNAKVSNATHTGDATGDTVLTLATVNANVGIFTNPTLTLDAKGRVTAAENGVVTTPFTCITATLDLTFDFEDNYAVATVSNSVLTLTNFRSFTFIPIETTETSLDDFILNGVSFNIENIVNNTSFDIKATSLNGATGAYRINYYINYQ